MKLNESALAKASGVLGAVYFLVCYAAALFAPGLYKLIADTWFHMMDFSSIWKAAPSGFWLGLVSFSVFSYLTGWLLAWTYNRFTK